MLPQAMILPGTKIVAGRIANRKKVIKEVEYKHRENKSC